MQKASLFFLVCAGLLGLTLLPTTALAAWPHDPYAGNVALCTAANDQRNTTIISDGVGGAIVTWQDTRNGNDHDDSEANPCREENIGVGRCQRHGLPPAAGAPLSAGELFSELTRGVSYAAGIPRGAMPASV